jgi:membrane-bound metal-dependent hydrolase YbcI (DUF457 family)
MFIGHFGFGLGAKKAAPRISLGTLFLAAQFLDLLWPTFILLGWEHVKIELGHTKLAPLNFTDYPISHSLLMAFVWGLLFGLVYYLFKRNYKNAVILFLCVISHWILDLIVHAKDLPLYPGHSPLLGFGLWNNVPLEIIVEGLIFLIGLVLYVRTTKSVNKKGIFVFWSLIVVLIGIHLANIFGSPPPNVSAIAWAGELQWLFVIWAYWADANRVVRLKQI